MLERLQIGLAKDSDPLTGLYPSHISEYERGIREPPLRVLLEYARVAQVPMEVLVDQYMSLPDDFTIPFYSSIIKQRKRKLVTVRVVPQEPRRKLVTIYLDSKKPKIEGSQKTTPKSFKRKPK